MQKNPVMNTIFSPDCQGPAVTDAEIEQLRYARAAINGAITKSRKGMKVSTYDKNVVAVLENPTTRETLLNEVCANGWAPGVIEGPRGDVSGLELAPQAKPPSTGS